jgi:hypothetical protein
MGRKTRDLGFQIDDRPIDRSTSPGGALCHRALLLVQLF